MTETNVDHWMDKIKRRAIYMCDREKRRPQWGVNNNNKRRAIYMCDRDKRRPLNEQKTIYKFDRDNGRALNRLLIRNNNKTTTDE